MSAQWYIARQKQKHGPYPFEQLQQWARTGMLLPTEMVLRDSGKWQEAGSVAGLFEVPVAVAVICQGQGLSQPEPPIRRSDILTSTPAKVFGGVLLGVCVLGVSIVVSVWAFNLLGTLFTTTPPLGKPSQVAVGTHASPSKGEGMPATPDGAMSPEDLIAIYEKNALAADERFKGKAVTVAGKVNSVFPQDGYIVLLFETDALKLKQVRCLFSTNDKEVLSKLSKGDAVVVEGTGGGKGLLGWAILIVNPRLLQPRLDHDEKR